MKKVEDEDRCIENYNITESAIMDNNIPVVESYDNKSGDLMVVCETEDNRDELKHLVTSANYEIVMNIRRKIRPSLIIVGLRKEYNREKIINMLMMQNNFMKKFAVSINTDDHIKMFAVRQLKNNESCFQVFANVSSYLREGFRYFKDKVTLGLISCKIYDRYHVKRCNNCQKM